MLATGSRAQALYIAETVFGTLPAAPAMTLFRPTGITLELNRKTLKSMELRHDRQTSDLRLGNFEVGGDLDFQLSYGDFDLFLAAVLGSSWSSEATGTPNKLYAANPAITLEAFATAAGTVGPFTHTAAHLPVQPHSVIVAIGGVIATDDGAGNLTGAGISAGTINYLTGAASITYSAAETGAITISYRYTSPIKQSFSVEVGYLDIGEFLLYTGCTVDHMTLSIKPNEMVKGKMTFLGSGLVINSASQAASVIQPTTNSPMDSFTGVIQEGGAGISIVTGMDLDIKANEEAGFVVGSKSMTDHFPGRIDVSGKLDAYFQDATLLSKFLNETESSIEVTLAGIPTNRTLAINLPRVKYTKGSAPVTNEKGLVQNMPFDGLLDETTFQTEVAITRANV